MDLLLFLVKALLLVGFACGLYVGVRTSPIIAAVRDFFNRHPNWRL